MITMSETHRKNAKTMLATITTMVVETTSARDGKVTFVISDRVSEKNRVMRFQLSAIDITTLGSFCSLNWQARRDSNPQHSVLETDALPIGATGLYSRISVTVPAPTVRPPSRIANRTPFSIAIGAINSTESVTLSPGITISVPSGIAAAPVTSVVRK